METQKKNIDMSELTKRTYVYKYSLIEDGDYTTLHEDGVPMHFTQKELRRIAQDWKKGLYKNGCTVEVLEKSVQDRFLEAVIEQTKDVMEETGYEYNEVSVMPDLMPMELEWAVKRILGIPDRGDYQFDETFDSEEELGKPMGVSVHYFVTIDGREMEQVCEYALRLDLCNVMFEVMDNKPESVTEFDFMKQESPEAYKYIRQDIQQWADNLNLSKYNKRASIVLKDFPEEVHKARFNY